MTDRNEEKAGSRRLLPVIIILIVLAVIGLLVAIGFVTGIFGSKYRRNESLNESKYDHYEEAPYSINGDGVIYDREGIKVTVTGIYHESDEDYLEHDGFITGIVRVGFLVENYFGEDVELRISCNSINGVTASHGYVFISDKFKNNKTVQIYEDILLCPGAEIAEMVVDEVLVYNKDGHGLGYAFDPVVITTTSDLILPEYDLSEYYYRYEDENFLIYSCEYPDDYHDGYRLYVENKSDHVFWIYTNDLTIDGTSVYPEGLNAVCLLPGHILLSDQIYSYDEVYASSSLEYSEVQIDLSFIYPYDSSENYDTGYFTLY